MSALGARTSTERPGPDRDRMKIAVHELSKRFSRVPAADRVMLEVVDAELFG